MMLAAKSFEFRTQHGIFCHCSELLAASLALAATRSPLYP